MIRFMFGTVLAAALAVGVALYIGLPEDDAVVAPTKHYAGAGSHPEFGAVLYTPVKLEPLATGPTKTNLLPIEPCHVVVRLKQEVSSPKDGHLLFIGQDVTGVEAVEPNSLRPILTINVFDGKDILQRKYRPLKEGDIVEDEQVVAVVDPALAIAEYSGKEAKVVAARADHKASELILNESRLRWQRLKDLQARSGKGFGTVVVTDEEMGTAQVTYDKYLGEEVSKKQAIFLAEEEKKQANLILTQHFLKSTGKSVVKKIYKFKGEGFKAYEPILQLNSISQLRIEGAVGAQYLKSLESDMECYLEPSVEAAPHLALIKAHHGEVNSVAVCADGERFISGSEDHTAYVWHRSKAAPLHLLQHNSAVRVVACSPKTNLLVAGCADGTLWLWNLDGSTQPTLLRQPLKDHHHGAISALAFSPDGNYFASGGEDNAIHVWKSNGDLLYAIDSDEGHQGTVTSLTFTPQAKLISAARDNTLRIWDLFQKGATASRSPIGGRGGNVSQLGVSADGRFMLFDQGKTLQLINTADGLPVCVLDNMSGATPFDTLALFSPDGKLMLTGGAGEGRLQLWKTPTPEDRAFQVRELVTKDRSAITTSAFGPGASGFAVTGSKDGYVHLWALPSKEAVDNHRIFKDANNQPLRLDLVDQALDGNKSRVAVNVENPQDQQRHERLLPGQRVTLVVVLTPPK
jgi:WD40 repeat protein